MPRKNDADTDDYDELDGEFEPDYDVDLIEAASVQDITASTMTKSAWQRIEERTESRLLRDQLSDWDEYFDG